MRQKKYEREKNGEGGGKCQKKWIFCRFFYETDSVHSQTSVCAVIPFANIKVRPKGKQIEQTPKLTSQRPEICGKTLRDSRVEIEK